MCVYVCTQPQQSPESLNDPHAPYSYATEDIVWRNVFLFIWLHTLAVYGIFLIATGHVKWQTTFTGNVIRSDHMLRNAQY